METSTVPAGELLACRMERYYSLFAAISLIYHTGKATCMIMPTMSKGVVTATVTEASNPLFVYIH